MNFHGLFIGIGKYSDPDVPDLIGAARDATALHALFADTISGSTPLLLVDDMATRQRVLQALTDLESAAGPDDTVVLYFSGHGSHDHRLAMHDTSLTDLASTTVSMQNIAEFFKRTSARSVLCVLDCCFSGGAPAKVLENSPIPRDAINPFEGLIGEGRVLLTACKIDEVAYESPTTRHGILTKALLDLLYSVEGTVNLLTAMDTILETVRAEAARMGIVQTPVLLGSVTGGLMLPKLIRGQLFRKAFPEYSPITVSRHIEDLKRLGFPHIVVDAWSNKYPDGLNELQMSAINDHRLAEGTSLLLVAPTTSGKTFVGEMAAAKAITEGRKAVFLFPYKALVNEKYDQFAELYGDRFRMRVIRCTGDYTDEADSLIRGKYDLAVLTYEMFLQSVLTAPGIRQQLGLLVLDEAQFITDPNRGINVELLLTHILAGREVGANPQLIALSAVIGNANSFHDWLGSSLLMSDKRPVPLIEGVIDRDGVYEYVDANGNRQIEQMIPSDEIVLRTGKPSAQDVIVPLVRKLVGAGEQVIVFRNQRGSAQGCAAYLARDLGLPPAETIIELLPTSDASGASAVLRTCLQGGTAFHTTNLIREERAIVEQAFRELTSRVRVLAATTTVAAGINTPASTVILAEQEFVGDDDRPFTVAEYKNMAGRAGRLGFREEGKAIIYAENSSERDRLLRTYVLGRLENLHSSFEGKQLDTWILRLLAQVNSIPRGEVVRLLANTYAGYLANRRDPSWRKYMQAEVENLLQRMIAFELLEVEGDQVRLTLLGRACGRSALSFNSALHLVELIRTLPKDLITAENMIAFVQILEEMNGYTPMLQGNREAVRTNEAAQRYGDRVPSALQRFASSNSDFWARCKRAAIMFDWIAGIRIEAIEAQFSTTPYRGKVEHGDIRRFADTTRFVLRSAAEILALLIPDGKLPEELDIVLNQLEVGLPREALGLLDLPITLTRGQYLDLSANGIRTVESLWRATRKTLESVLSSATLVVLEKRRPVESAKAGGASTSLVAKGAVA